MKKAEIQKTVDTNYKDGFVKCVCGWHKKLGDGFNQYHINNCPNCTPELETRNQTVVTTGSKGNYKKEYGRFVYFVISNGCHIQYSKNVHNTVYSNRA